MENCAKLIEEVRKILATFIKNPARVYSAKNILNKSTKLKEIYIEFNKSLEILKTSKSIPKENIDDLHSKFNDIYCKTKSILDKKSREIYNESIKNQEDSDIDSDSSSITENNIKMAKFDLVTAIKILPEFSGETKDLDNFLKITEIYEKSLKSEEKENLIEFIWHARLTQKARNKLATTSAPKTFAELKQKLQGVFKTSDTPQRIHTQLSHIKQHNLRVKDYADKILALVENLNNLQITELGESNREIIKQLNDGIALNTFQNGLKEPLKTTILAARCKTLTEAISLAEQTEKPIDDESRIFQFTNTKRTTWNYRAHPKNKINYNNNKFNYSRNTNNNGFNAKKYNNNNNNRNMRTNNNNNNKNSNRNNNYNRNNRIHFLQDSGDDESTDRITTT